MVIMRFHGHTKATIMGRSLCLTDNLVTSHISCRNTTMVRIEIRDVRSTLGEWANSGTSSPTDLGRIDGVKAVDAMLNNVQGYLNSSGWNLDLSFEMRFGLEFEIAKFIKLKLGSIISSKIPLLGSAQEINFGIFASLGVEVESLFSATAEAQQQFGYNLSYDNWSLDATTMLFDLFNPFLSIFGWDRTSKEHRANVARISKPRATQLNLLLDLSVPGSILGEI